MSRLMLRWIDWSIPWTSDYTRALISFSSSFRCAFLDVVVRHFGLFGPGTLENSAHDSRVVIKVGQIVMEFLLLFLLTFPYINEFL